MQEHVYRGKYRRGQDPLFDFEEPVRAVTPGSGGGIYDGEFVAGGGIIIGK